MSAPTQAAIDALSSAIRAANATPSHRTAYHRTEASRDLTSARFALNAGNDEQAARYCARGMWHLERAA